VRHAEEEANMEVLVTHAKNYSSFYFYFICFQSIMKKVFFRAARFAKAS